MEKIICGILINVLDRSTILSFNRELFTLFSRKRRKSRYDSPCPSTVELDIDTSSLASSHITKELDGNTNNADSVSIEPSPELAEEACTCTTMEEPKESHTPDNSSAKGKPCAEDVEIYI